MKFLYFLCFMTLLSAIKASRSEIKKTEDPSSSSKTLFKTQAVVEEIENTYIAENNFFDRTKLYFRKVMALDSITQCKPENCEFCCISLNFCGSKEQCENSKNTLNILRIIFYIICSILTSFLIYKIYITDSHPKQEDYEKIDDQSLNILIGLFIQNKENRRKMKM